MIVVVAIILVLASISMLAFRSPKRTSHFKAAQGAASSYQDAIEAYMADNGQTPPALGSAAWASTPRDKLVLGPVDAMLKNPDGSPHRYLHGTVPDSVASGLVDIGTATTPSMPNAQAYIRYEVAGSTYRLYVQTLPADDEQLTCVVSNSPTLPSGWKAC